MKKLTVQQALTRAEAYLKKGDLDSARELYVDIIRRFPGNNKAVFGLAQLDRAQHDQPVDREQLGKAIAFLGTLHHASRHAELAKAAKQFIQKYPGSFELWTILAGAQNSLGQTTEAEKCFRKVIELKPDYAEAHSNLGVVLESMGRLDDAISAHRSALEINPQFYIAHFNLGNVYKETGRLEDAVNSYRAALSIVPFFAQAHNNLGIVLVDLHRLDEAVSAYQKAINLEPENASAYYNLGLVFTEKGLLDNAIVNYQKALSINPKYANAYNNMGVTLQEQGKLDAAIAAYQRALEIKPAYAIAEAQMLHQQQHICDFSIVEKLSDASARLGVKTEAVSPFLALSWDDNPRQHQLRAVNWAREKYKKPPLLLPARPKTRPKRLKIGYFSADFHNHAGMYLMAGMFEKHNREEFEIFAFSYGPNILDDMRNRISSSFDYFLNIEGKSTSEIVGLVKNKHLDIAIHRNGYTSNSRTDIFETRIAPIQISFLGYPGTLGTEFIDYIISDSVVIPAEQRHFYSEKVIYLPHSYQPNDDERLIAATRTTRSDLNLPEKSFVFCCFNNNYKISPAEFDIWMRILNKVDGSVLWLLRSNKWAEGNLRKEAVERGIDPSRLIFAPKLPHSEHLARHRHADLFIDTFNVNAHTTASDALWSGLPVVTKQGKQFAARVAASLLTAIGLPELITETEEHYEQLILELTKNPKKMDLIKAKLAENRLKSPLFDTERYTRNFERGLMQVYNLYYDGKEPEDITVIEKGLYSCA
jgi:predicted O-linked N-acetylglucosamine transferase (SPINDLY family)